MGASTSCTTFIVSEECYPRFIFMKNQVNGLLKRESNLRKKLRGILRSDSHILNKELDGTIIVHVFQSVDSKQAIDENDILICKGSCKKSNSELKDKYLERKIEKHKRYSLQRTAYILVQQTIGKTEFTRRIAVAQNKADKEALSKRLKRNDNITVCLKESISEEISKVLERNVFHGLNKRCEYLSSSLKGAVFDEYEEKAERLLCDMIGLYNRSHVPEHERPKVAVEERNEIPPKLLEDFRIVSARISWCGYSDRTLCVFVDEKTPSKMLCEEIRDVLKKHNINKYTVESSIIIPFASCPSGSKVEVYPSRNSRPHYGTLAGFVRSDIQKGLYALVARHVSLPSYDRKVYISKEECSITGKIMVDMNNSNAAEGTGRKKAEENMGNVLDVAAARIDRYQEEKCGFNFKTEQNKSVSGILCEYTPNQLQGLPVHIWGTSSTPGLGRIAIGELKKVQEPPDDEPYLEITDREVDSDDDAQSTTPKPFCKEGDSGAMVLTHDPDTNGRKVQLISMVVGKNINQDRLYTTVKLKDGLAQIESGIGEKVSLC